MSKEQLRKKFKKQRQQVLPLYKQEAALAAAQILITQNIFKQCTHIACYLPYQNEFNTIPIIENIWLHHKTCYLPILTPEKELLFASYHEGEELQENRYSILEPIKTETIKAHELELVILPLIAFDAKGNRLGTGGGYYDRTFSFLQSLSKTAPRPFLLGLGYALQQINEIPVDVWDIKLDGVLTEKGWQQF